MLKFLNMMGHFPTSLYIFCFTNTVPILSLKNFKVAMGSKIIEMFTIIVPPPSSVMIYISKSILPY